MSILGSQKKQHVQHLDDDGRAYTTKVYSMTARVYDSEGVEGQLCRKNFETMILNTAILSGAGGVRVVTLTD